MKKIRPLNLSDLASMAPVQQGMLVHYLRNPESLHYVEKLTVTLRGNIRLHLFKQAWKNVIQTNPALRTFFKWEKMDTPVQVTLKNRSYEPLYQDLTEINPDSPKPVNPEEIIPASLNLEEVPFFVFLFKIADSRFEMILLHHHILFDGWSTGIILKEFFSHYNALQQGKTPVIQSKNPYSRYIKWLKNRKMEEEEQFWSNYLAPHDDVPLHSLLTSPQAPAPTPAGSEPVVYVQHFINFNESNESMEAFIKSHQTTLSTLLNYAWGLLLRIYLNADDVLFGTTVSGRNIPVEGVRDMVGLFINTIPLRLRRHRGETIAEELNRLQRETGEREPFEHSALTDIDRWRQHPPFDTIVVVENYPIDILSMSAHQLSADGYTIRESTPYPLTLVATTEESVGEIKLTFISDREELPVHRLKRMALHYTEIIQQIIRYPRREPIAIDILSNEEKQQLLFTYNDTAVDYPKSRYIHLIFADRARQMPGQAAISGASTSGADSRLTYGELNRAADDLASQLLEKGITPGNDMVALLTGRSVETVVAIFGILKAGAAFLPIDPLYPGERIKYMLADSNVRLVLTAPNVKQPKVANVQYLDIGELTAPKETAPQPGHGEPATLSTLSAAPAYAIYTSGTTGRPKGVLVEHSALANIILHLQNAYPLGQEDAYLFKTNYCFDVSLTEIFGWFPGGGSLTVPAEGVEKDPALLVEAIKNNGITHINFVPSMFNVFVQNLTPADGIKLSSLKYIFLAGEALAPAPVQRLRRICAEACPRVENLYGPTEATIYAGGFSLSPDDPKLPAHATVPIGGPLSNTGLYIVGRDGRLQPDGLAGELCIGGTGLALGYLNRPQLTAEKFVSPHPSWQWREIEETAKTANRLPARIYPARIYKTGDLVRRLPDNNIEFMGRLDHQVKIRGFRIELGEIEHHLNLQYSVADARVMAGHQQLLAYIVPQSRNTPHQELEPELRTALETVLPDYMIPGHFIFLERLPLTPSGKLDRSNLPRPADVAAGDNYIPPADATESALADIWAGILDLDTALISREANFFHLGGHSLNAVPMLSRIHKKMDVQVPMSQLFASPALHQLARYIRSIHHNSAAVHAEPIASVENKEYYPLSAEQKRIFVLEQMERLGTSYNLPILLEMRGHIQHHQLEKIFAALIHRHEAFRTSFGWHGSDAVQFIRDQAQCVVQQFQTQGGEEEKEAVFRLIREFVRPFDLSTAPLLRVGKLHIRDGFGYLLVDMHHIISDGISLDILHREMAGLHQGLSLPTPKVTYKDYTAWCNGPQRRNAMEQQAAYWLEQYHTPAPRLELPFDFPRPPKRDFRGGSLFFTLSPETFSRLSALAESEGVTLFMLLLAIFNVFLAKLCDQEDIVAGVPSAGRNHQDLEPVIGMFVNTLALRNQPRQNLAFADFLQRLKDNTLKAFENNDYQFQDLVERLNITRDPGRNPLFDAVFSFRTAARGPGTGKGQLELKPMEFERHISHFDLMLFVLETAEGLDMHFEYALSLFKPATISQFKQYFEEITGQILENNHITIKDIKLSHHMVAISSKDILNEEGDFGF